MKIEEAINRFNSARHELLRGTEQEVLSNIRKIELLDVALMSFEEIQKYRAIGTVEECRAAMEKQKLKSRIIIEGKYFCPVCKNLMEYPGYCGCGQRLY